MMNLRIRILIFAVFCSFLAVNAWADIYTWLWIPHVAAGGGYTSYLTIRDPHGVSTRTVYVDFYDDNGQPLPIIADGQSVPIVVEDGVARARREVQLNAFQERSIALTAGSSVLQGQIQIKAQGIGNLNASLRFAYVSASGNLINVVGILPAEPNFNWTVAVEKREPSDDTGVAVAYPWLGTTPMSVTFDLYQNGTRVPGASPVTKSIVPKGHLAIFVSQLFPGVNYSGVATLRLSSANTSFSAVALRADANLSLYSSLPTDAGVQYWNVNITGISGSVTWTWRFFDGYTYTGYETNPYNANAIRLRGVVDSDANFFIAEWNYWDIDGTQGVILYQGTLGKVGSTDVVTGKRMQVRSDGQIVTTAPFTATRIS